ncbi:MAG: response regulator transcription factor [Elusimicrobia bacterium]|nr:response regulator transcription factor [Elusimicrobiota bacterium]
MADKILQSKKILAIDDEPDILELIKAVVCTQDHEFDLRCERDSRRIACAIEKGVLDCDLILLDLGMPRFSGQALLDKIKTDARCRDIPVVILTASERLEDNEECLNIGADYFVKKPFTGSALLATIRAVWRRVYDSAGIPGKIEMGAVVVGLDTKEVSVLGRPLGLTPTEFSIFLLLAEHKSQYVHQRIFLDRIWGLRVPSNEEIPTKRVQTNIDNIRRKLGSYRDLVATKERVGFKFNEELADAIKAQTGAF